jgi:hypothetical protein
MSSGSQPGGGLQTRLTVPASRSVRPCHILARNEAETEPMRLLDRLNPMQRQRRGWTTKLAAKGESS